MYAKTHVGCYRDCMQAGVCEVDIGSYQYCSGDSLQEQYTPCDNENWGHFVPAFFIHEFKPGFCPRNRTFSKKLAYHTRLTVTVLCHHFMLVATCWVQGRIYCETNGERNSFVTGLGKLVARSWIELNTMILAKCFVTVVGFSRVTVHFFNFTEL